jgi:hypothetical protein
MRTILICLLIVAAGALQAFGQVAAPSLLPGTARVIDPEQFNALAVPVLDRSTPTSLTFLPENPAAMQWSLASELGLGAIHATGHYDDGVTPGNIDFNGEFAGLRWARHYVSLGAQGMTWHGGSQATANDKQTLFGYAGAFQLFDTIALGASSEQSRQAFDFTIGAGTKDELHLKHNLAGTSIRLGSSIYLGYTAGTENFDLRNLTTPANNTTMKRNVKAYGIAYRGNGPNPWHLEVFRSNRDFVTDGANYVNKEQETVGVLEARFGRLIAGLQSRHDEATRAPISTAFKETINSHQLTLAWITQGNWTWTAHLERNTFDGGDILAGYAFHRTTNATALSLGRRF